MVYGLESYKVLLKKELLRGLWVGGLGFQGLQLQTFRAPVAVFLHSWPDRLQGQLEASAFGIWRARV